MQGDAAGGTLPETVRSIIADGVVPRMEAHGVETWRVDVVRGDWRQHSIGAVAFSSGRSENWIGACMVRAGG